MFYSIEIDNFLLKYDWKRKMIALCGKCRGDTDNLLPPDAYGSRFRQYVKKMTLDRGNLIPSVRYDDDEELESDGGVGNEEGGAGELEVRDAAVLDVNVASEAAVNGGEGESPQY